MSGLLRTPRFSYRRPHRGQQPIPSGLLWDSWIVFDAADELFHRFVLSAPSTAAVTSGPDGIAERDHLAVIRHFVSVDAQYWHDLGNTGIDGWSGSAVIADDRLYLYYTAKGADQKILRAIDSGAGDGFGASETVLDPGQPTTRAAALELGYHLGSADGYLPAWRDPHVQRAAAGGWEMHFAAKLDHPTVAPAIGRAESRDGRDWVLAPPVPIEIAGSPLPGQIELPVPFAHAGREFMMLSHSWQEGAAVLREVRVLSRNDEHSPWAPATGSTGVLFAPSSQVYGVGVCADPKKPGELLGYGFYWTGARAMTLTPVAPVTWRDRTPAIRFET